MKYVIKHTDRNEYVRCRSLLSFWRDDINEATQFDTLEDAQIEIIQRGIPYVTAVPNNAETSH